MREADRAAAIAGRVGSAATARRWREGAEYRALARVFEACPPDAAADRAERLFADSGWAGALLAPLVAALAADPFFEPPLRFNRDGVATGAVIFDCPAASIIASVANAAAMRAQPPPMAIVFSGFTTVTRYEKAGGATLRRWRSDPFAALAPLALSDGDIHRNDGRAEAQLAGEPRSDMVQLVATIRTGAAPLMREHAIASGALLRTASADEAASRTEMLLAFLRHAGRADARERFAEASRDPAFHTRWAAMREWLALDARAALPRLAEMAEGDAHAEIRAAAVRTLPLAEAACLA
jgi:hypothetical protein